MTPKIARFLAQQQPATPCLVLDVDRVEDNFRALQRALPLARIYYAVKANPAPPDAGAAGWPGSATSMPRASRKCPPAWMPARARGDQLRQHDQEGVGDPGAHSRAA